LIGKNLRRNPARELRHRRVEIPIEEVGGRKNGGRF